jgi:curved DNA-binding protein
MDYYSILGVSRNATSEEIKKAYRKLAMKHHPDRGGDTQKLAQINEAYDILKDPTKRQQYDNPQQQYKFNTQNMHSAGMGGFEDVFAQAFGFAPQNMRRRARNQDISLSYTISFSDIFTGKDVTVSYNLPSGRPEHLDIRIPPGIRSGDVINFAGYGDDSIPNLARGNLILKIKITPHPIWTRNDDNLSTTKKINVLDLILGTSIEVTSPTGKMFSLNIPKGTKPNTIFSIPGHGVPNVNTNRPGNLYVKIEALIPNITDKQILKQIEDIKNATS